MKQLGSVVIVALLGFGAGLIVTRPAGTETLAHAQDQKTFPTDDEINLLLTQTDRAVQQYKPLIDQEEIQMGKSDTEAVTRDRQVVKALETAVKGFKAQPQRFNGPLGFAFFEWLDDASRNASLCAGGAFAQSTMYIIDGKMDKANQLISLAHSCTDASSLIYTVSENAGALYTRYTQGEEQLATQAVDASRKCLEVLQKNRPAPKR